MDHIAILRKSNIKKGDNLLDDILEGKKTIESRWYANRIAPWNKIKANDTVYFKESGRPVTAKAAISKVIQYENLTQQTIKEIIDKYGKMIAPSTTLEDFKAWSKNKSNKRYCILIFLKNVEKIQPFKIDKVGYGSSAAWLVTDDIKKLQI